MRAIATRDTAIEKRIAALLTGAGFTFVARIARCRDARFRLTRLPLRYLYSRLFLASP
nr:Very short patch repair protein [Klebsiella pneumoniae]